jgi:Aspartyl/Asparaginyl beta-hydroxylase
MLASAPSLTTARPSDQTLKIAKKVLKRIVPIALTVIFIPKILAFYVCCGLADVLRNQHRTISTLNRYFTGNGICTWLLSPFNLVMDVFAFPFRNRGIYKLADLPPAYQDEINSIITAAHESRLIERLESKMEGQKRGMLFFKWYGKNVATSVEVPEFHRRYKFIRTIGVSIFNKKQSTGKHYGPLRVTLRVLYNINPIDSRDVYIKVGNKTHFWNENQLFIFDDTLQHQSVNEADAVRYCMFVDILRPSYLPGLFSAILSCVRVLIARFNSAFYKNWTFLK